jgi:hypothetical protein
MTWLRPVDRTSGTLTLSAGTLSCLAHHRTPLSKRCPTTTALERTTVPMDEAERMPPVGAVKPRQKLFDDIHRAQCVAPWNSGTRYNRTDAVQQTTCTSSWFDRGTPPLAVRTLRNIWPDPPLKKSATPISATTYDMASRKVKPDSFSTRSFRRSLQPTAAGDG